MKIKKSELKRLIENYLYEQQSLMTKPETGTVRYPEEIETDSQKRMYDMHLAPEKRQRNTSGHFKYPEVFENAFETHINNWKVFSNAHPMAAFFLQIIDISGVSGWADLATSIEAVNKPNATVFDQLKYFLNFLGALPMGMIFMGSGRIITIIANKILPIFNSSNKIQALTKVFNAGDNWLELLKNVKEIKLFKGSIKKITDKLVEAGKLTKESALKILEKSDSFIGWLEKVLAGFDTVAAKAFFKFLLAVSEKIGESFSEHVLDFYIDNPDQASLHMKKGHDLGEHIYKNSPEFFQIALDKAAETGQDAWSWLISSAGLD